MTDFATDKDHKKHKANLKKVKVAIERKNRVDIVNDIIKDISSRGRRFFYNDGVVAKLTHEYGKTYYNAEWGEVKKICLTIPNYRTPKGWFHGGTLLNLVKEFNEFIKNGQPREYSVLFSEHWGYPDSDMVAIRKKAFELKYIKTQ